MEYSLYYYGGKRGPRKQVNIQGSSPSSEAMTTKRKSGKNAKRPVRMNKEIMDKLKHEKGSYRGQKQGLVGIQ